jgi:hypothetical protein
LEDPAPYRDRDDRLNLGDLHDDIAEAIADPEEARVTWALASDLVTEPGLETVGDLIDHLDAVGPSGRRRLLDEAREPPGSRRAHPSTLAGRLRPCRRRFLPFRAVTPSDGSRRCARTLRA